MSEHQQGISTLNSISTDLHFLHSNIYLEFDFFNPSVAQ